MEPRRTVGMSNRAILSVVPGRLMRLNLSSLFLFLWLAPAASAVDWRPVNPSELAQKTPRVDATADAEAIFWDVYLEDRLEGGDLSLAMRHYVRLKIFTE